MKLYGLVSVGHWIDLFLCFVVLWHMTRRKQTRNGSDLRVPHTSVCVCVYVCRVCSETDFNKEIKRVSKAN